MDKEMYRPSKVAFSLFPFIMAAASIDEKYIFVFMCVVLIFILITIADHLEELKIKIKMK